MKNKGGKMGKYALIVTDTGMFPGTNAMINAFPYYNIQAEFHYLYKGKAAQKFAEERSEDIVAVDIEDLKKQYGVMHFKGDRESVWYCKMYRYLYAINHLIDYDAVMVIDADMCIVNDITPWFEIADKTGKLCIPNNDYSSNEYDQFNFESLKGASSPPLHNMPSFFKPSLWVDVMKRVPEISLEGTFGDMTSLSRSLIESGKINDGSLIVNPNALWVVSHFCHIKLHRRLIGNKQYLALNNIAGDRLYSVHRRWWMASVRRKFVEDIRHADWAKDFGKNNVDLFYWFYKFFNTNKDMKYHIDWKPEYDKEN
jgi:hypothetical protein